jgi:hypothetical protein
VHCLRQAEDNTDAKFSPSASLEITLANPALIGKFKAKAEEEYYVDFTPTEYAQEWSDEYGAWVFGHCLFEPTPRKTV